MNTYNSNLLLIHFFMLLLHTATISAQRTDPYLLYTNRHFIRRVNLDGASGQQVLYEGGRGVNGYTGIDLDIRTGSLYFSDNFRFAINSGHVNGSSQQPPQLLLSTTDKTNVEDVAYDWVNRKLYWTNRNERTVKVIDPVTGYQKTLLQFPNNTARNIILDPLNRLMYWTAWDEAANLTGKVFRASMDGSDRVTLLQSPQVTWPNGLAIDYDTQTLYVADASKDIFATLTTNGDNFNIIKQLDGRINVVSLEFHENRIYYAELFNERIYSFDINNPSELRLVVNHDPIAVHGIRVVDPSRQPLAATNPCEINNGGCSHLCLLSASEPTGYSCACPDNVADTSECFGPTIAPSTTSTTQGARTSSSSNTPSIPSTGSSIPAARCSDNPCLNNGNCIDLPQGGVVCTCPRGFTGPDCSASEVGNTEEVRSSSEFVVSGGVFLAVTGALVAIILILAFIIAISIFATLRSKHHSKRASKRNSIAGLTDPSPRDSPTHVVVGRLPDHDYISIKSRESPAPRGIVINIESLGGRCTPNQYTIHKGVHSSSLPSNLVLQNGGSQAQNTADTLPVPSKHHGNGTIEMNTNLSDSDTESEYNSLAPKVDVV